MYVLIQQFKSQRGGYRRTEDNVITYISLLKAAWYSHNKLIGTKQIANFKRGSLAGLLSLSC